MPEKDVEEKALASDSGSRGLTRRDFIQFAGGATALALAGAAGLRCGPDMVEEAVDSSAESTGEHDQPGGVEPTMDPVALRHSRHRRQVLEGFIDTTLDEYRDCERNCTGSMFAHQLEGGEQWL